MRLFEKRPVEPDTSKMTISYSAYAWHVGYLEASDIQSEYATTITFPWVQWLHERSSVILNLNFSSCF